MVTKQHICIKDLNDKERDAVDAYHGGSAKNVPNAKIKSMKFERGSCQSMVFRMHMVRHLIATPCRT